MLRRISLAALCVLTTSPAAADYAAGVRAWGRGDVATAAREFLPAAQAGDAEAQFMMGRLYAMGAGVPTDWVRAWQWHDRAARQGHAEARTSRESMETILTPAQLAAASASAAPVRVARPAPPPAQPVPVVALAPPDHHRVVLVPRRGVVAEGRGGPEGGGGPEGRGGPLASLTAPAATEEGRLLAAGSLDHNIRLVQHRLNRAGYDAGPVDGVPGAQTREAIRAWQRRHGLTPSGIVTVELLASLDQAEADQQAAR